MVNYILDDADNRIIHPCRNLRWSLFIKGVPKYTPGKKVLAKFSKLTFHSVRHWMASWKICQYDVYIPGHKKLTFGVAKVVLVSTLFFKDYTVNFTLFARHVTRYIHITLTIFQEATQCLTLWKISLEFFCKNFFPGVYERCSTMTARRKDPHDKMILFVSKFTLIY